MAPAADPSQAGESKNLMKDALYLFELFRESPQAILVCTMYLTPLNDHSVPPIFRIHL